MTLEALSVFLSVLALAAAAAGSCGIFLDIDRANHDKTYATLCHALVAVGAVSIIIAMIIQHNL